MPTPLVIPNANVGDAVLVDRNALGALVSAAYNSIPGDNIASSSVPTSALQKPKANFVHPLLQYFGNVQSAFTGVTGLKQVLPYMDGASSSTYRFLHVKAGCRTLTGATGTLDILKNGTSMFASPPFNFATMTSGNPVVASPLAPVPFVSWNGTNDDFQFQFSALTGTITDIDIMLWFSQNHSGT